MTSLRPPASEWHLPTSWTDGPANPSVGIVLYFVKMTVNLPHDLDAALAEELKIAEKQLSLALQREGVWRHLWRVAGRYENYSVFDVADHDALHRVLSGLPLFPYMDVHVTALAEHPSALSANGG